jgi:hypothetical protein
LHKTGALALPRVVPHTTAAPPPPPPPPPFSALPRTRTTHHRAQIHEEVTEHVKEFQARSLKELPESVEDSIQKQAEGGGNPAAWVVYKVCAQSHALL